MKRIIQFDLDGSPVFVEVEEGVEYGAKRVSRSADGIDQAESRFTDAIARIRPAAEVVLKTFRELNPPDEINLEFGINFNAQIGAIFASAVSGANFKVSLKWKKS